LRPLCTGKCAENHSKYVTTSGISVRFDLDRKSQNTQSPEGWVPEIGKECLSSLIVD
jgi:hypothetical protein